MNKNLLELIRELSERDPKTLSQKGLKAAEELGELAKAILPYESAFATTHRFTDRKKILEEAVDNILTNLSVAYDLRFSDDEIEEMMKQKALYWGELQSREIEAKFPLPYEIHVTAKHDGSQGFIEEFRQICHNIDVKPLLLDLQNQSGETVLQDVMTSSLHVGNNTSAYQRLQDIVRYLKEYGLVVLREKIETVPWHPAAPSAKYNNYYKRPNCYFEAHIPIIVKSYRKGTSNLTAMEELKNLLRHSDLHLSKNVFKKINEDDCIIMATYRKYDGTREQFEESLAYFTKLLDDNFFSYEKVITEFAIYDSKIHHDASWLVSNEK